MTFRIEPCTELPEVALVVAEAHPDIRGLFFEAWHERKFAEAGLEARFVQDNVSRSRRGVVRGLHHQLPPAPQAKLVSVLAGEVFDVAVDVRQSSPTFGRWAGRRLRASDRSMMWVPIGFSHGFMALSDEAVVAYKVTAFHDPEFERAVRWDDPAIGIEWPHVDVDPIVSDRDRMAPRLADADLFS